MAGDVDAIDRALVEVPGNDGVTGAEVRILADPARAQHPTVADLEQSSFQMIGHGFPLLKFARNTAAISRAAAR
jgi:hypothetical protein